MKFSSLSEACGYLRILLKPVIMKFPAPIAPRSRPRYIPAYCDERGEAAERQIVAGGDPRYPIDRTAALVIRRCPDWAERWDGA